MEEFFHLELTGGLKTKHSGRIGAFRYQEETVTESVLGRVQALFDDVLLVETYDRPVEKQLGADWFWLLDFGSRIVPMLVQAKKIVGPWDGDEQWSVSIDQAQQKTLETTAKNWNVGAHFCFYAPSWDFRRLCFP